MNCPLCKNAFDCTSRLPVIAIDGATICSRCVSAESASNVVYNKQLIRLMGHCPEHISTPFSLFCIEDKKYVCEKCIIYGSKNQDALSKTFIENSKMKEVIAQKTK